MTLVAALVTMVMLLALCKLWINIPERRGFIIALCISGALFAIATFLVPFQPASDSLDLVDSIRYYKDNAVDGTYIIPYINFYATNKLAAFIYLGVCNAMGGIEMGMRFFNFAAGFGSSVFMALAFGKMFGSRYRGMALMIATVIFPYIIFSAPYIYTPTLLAASAAFYLLLSKNWISKIAGFLFLAIAFSMRPTGMAFIFVFMFIRAVWDVFKLRTYRRFFSMFTLVAALAFCIIFNGGVGFAMYKTGLHPYPNLTNGATLWTLELGTRLDSSRTGRCVYEISGEEKMANDPIAANMAHLWSIYSKSDPADYAEVKELQSQTTKMIIQRTKQTFTESSSNILKFLYYKTSTLVWNHVTNSRVYTYEGMEIPTGRGNWGDYPYYFMYNYNNPTFSQQLYHNIEEDSILYYEIIVYLSVLSAGILIFLAIRRRKFNIFLFAIGAGVLATALTFILLTEVCERYMLDAYIPIILIVISAIIYMAKNISVKPFVPPVAGIAAILLLYFMFSSNDLKAFKNMQFGIDKQDNTTTITFNLESEPGDSYAIILPDQEIYMLNQHTQVSFEGQNTIGIITPYRVIWCNPRSLD